MLKRFVQSSKSNRSKSKRVSPGQQQLPFAFDIRLNQIPEEWHQLVCKELFGGCSVEKIDVLFDPFMLDNYYTNGYFGLTICHG